MEEKEAKVKEIEKDNIKAKSKASARGLRLCRAERPLPLANRPGFRCCVPALRWLRVAESRG
jgi:hypothetical protein